MSDKLLTPFKAKFILKVYTTFKNFFEDSDKVNLSQKFKVVEDSEGTIQVSKFINQHRVSSNIFCDYKHLPFKYDQSFDVNPVTMANVDEDYSLHFSLESYDVKVIQIIGNKITFENKDKEIHTIETNENLMLK